MEITGAGFWVALMQIIGVNIVLSGDNAVVIALAARGLPAAQQKRAVAWGSGAAVVMRIVLTLVAVELLRLPILKLVGAALLLWIAVQLLMPEDEGGASAADASTLGAAIRTILLADLVMSLDNVIAVAAAARGQTLLLVLGLAISIPLVVFASRLLLTLMERLPIIITLGAALLGWVAGEMAVSDPAIAAWIEAQAAWLHTVLPAAGAVGVVVAGRAWAARARRAAHEAPTRPAPAVQAIPAAPRRLLVAVDGSEGSALAVREALRLVRGAAAAPVALHLVNVQRPLTGDVTGFVPPGSVDDYHRERSDEALAPARMLLGEAGVAHEVHRLVGEPGPAIADLAAALGADLIVMGTRGLGAVAGALLGSVARSTTEHAAVPVLLAK